MFRWHTHTGHRDRLPAGPPEPVVVAFDPSVDPDKFGDFPKWYGCFADGGSDFNNGGFRLVDCSLICRGGVVFFYGVYRSVGLRPEKDPLREMLPWVCSFCTVEK